MSTNTLDDTTDTLQNRRKARQEAKARAAARLKLIENSVQQARTTRDINDVRSDKVGAWNYELSADSDIYKRCCPLCFQAYSDFELTAVVPCWHCRDKMPLAQAISIAASVSVPMEDNNPPEIEGSDDVMISYLLDQIQQMRIWKTEAFEASRKSYKHEMPHVAAAKKRRAKERGVAYREQIKSLSKRLRLIQAGKEREFFEGVLGESKARQRNRAPNKAAQSKEHAMGRLRKLQSTLQRHCGDAYTLQVRTHPPKMCCNVCGASVIMNSSAELAASKHVGSIVSSAKARLKIFRFIEAHSLHTGKRVPEGILTATYW